MPRVRAGKRKNNNRFHEEVHHSPPFSVFRFIATTLKIAPISVVIFIQDTKKLFRGLSTETGSENRRLM